MCAGAGHLCIPRVGIIDKRKSLLVREVGDLTKLRGCEGELGEAR